ncbi:MAG: iron-sulfur cluster repair di-iron protein, ric [Tissierellaceae bacterium]
MKKFNEMKEKNLNMLKQYIPVVARVHGPAHPEFYDVAKVFGRLLDKLDDTGIEEINLSEEFKSLRQITNNYLVPSDVCESYEAVYNMIDELDMAYHS